MRENENNVVKNYLFKRCLAEVETYLFMKKNVNYDFEVVEKQRIRACAIYEVLDDLGMEDEYQMWKCNFLRIRGKDYEFSSSMMFDE